MKTLETLLENYWIVKEQDEETYNQLYNELDEPTQNFIKSKLGYRLIVNTYLIKLEKIPGKPQPFMGITRFSNQLEYIFLCMILIYLEAKSKKDQFILSQLIDFIQNAQVEIDLGDFEIDFNMYTHRNYLVSVLKYITELRFIKKYDGDENKFAENMENEVLYEVTGLSKYFVRNFTSNISDCNLYQDIYEKEQLGLEQDKGIERKQRIYRRIFTENVIYQEGSDDQDYLYIKNYKNMIQQDVENMLEASFEVHRNGAYLLLPEGRGFKNTFPNQRAISDIVTFVDELIIQKWKKKEIMSEKNDIIFITELEFSKLLQEVRNKYQDGFSKEYREKEQDKFEQEVIRFMEEFDMIRRKEEQKGYWIMPIVFKVVGEYPKDYKTEE